MPWPDELPRKVISPGLAEAIIFQLNLARAPWTTKKDALSSFQLADGMLDHAANLKWEDVFEPLVRRASVDSNPVRLEVDGQPEPVDQHSFADERAICAVMRLMAPLLMRFGVLVEFEDRGTKRSLSLTAITPDPSKSDHVH